MRKRESSVLKQDRVVNSIQSSLLTYLQSYLRLFHYTSLDIHTLEGSVSWWTLHLNKRLPFVHNEKRPVLDKSINTVKNCLRNLMIRVSFLFRDRLLNTGGNGKERRELLLVAVSLMEVILESQKVFYFLPDIGRKKGLYKVPYDQSSLLNTFYCVDLPKQRFIQTRRVVGDSDW